MPGSTIIGVEPSEEMRAVAETQNSHPNVTYVEGCAEEIPLDASSASVAWLSMMLHHVGDLHKCVQELYRVLKPEGVLLIRNNFTDHLEHARLYEFFPEALSIDLARFPSIGETQQIFESNGFSMITAEVVEQVIDTSLANYLKRVQQRVYSELELISDDEFEDGLERMQAAVKKEKNQKPVIDFVDLLTFQKNL